MIDIDTEDLLSLVAATKEPVLRNSRTGKPCHVAQLYRYIQRGARAANGEFIRLETIVTPSGRRTSREAISRFIAALTDPDLPLPTPRQRKHEQAAAERELEAAGFEIN